MGVNRGRRKLLRKKRWRISSSFYFVVACLLTGVFVSLPLFARIKPLRNVLTSFLRPLESVEYKTSYVETLGAFIGSFFAVTGAIWTQNIFDKRERRKQITKNALMVCYDLQFALDNIAAIVQEVYPKVGEQINRNDERAISIYRKAKQSHQIYIASDWKELILSLRDNLDDTALRNIQHIYNTISSICVSVNANTVDSNRIQDIEAYSQMRSLTVVSTDGKKENQVLISINAESMGLLDILEQLTQL